ncbi:hypothetical protein MNB_SV-9-1068 [hydrothermal vent metagenome]|uniref:Uncharacterized protein n=1 Tax=hydrothermal vent metagenome TaxID=652676 RepID=A0A1W1CBJ3_9ZZZZ
MGYFSKAKKGEKVYGLIFGRGKIINIFPDSYYTVMIEFDNGYEVPYTIDGIPSWGNFKKQTMYYRDDIDLCNEDFSPVETILAPRKIIKLREKNKLEIRLPSGIWKNIKKADEDYIENLLSNEQYHLFRKRTKI